MIEPGGHLILQDGDPLMFTHENPLPLEGHEPDIVAYTQGKSTLATINRIFSGWALRQGFVVGCTHLSLRSALGLIRPQHFVSFPEDAPRYVSSGLVIYASPCPSRGILCVPQGAKRDISFGVHGVFPPELFSEPRRSDFGHDEGRMSGVDDGIRNADEEEREVLMKEVRDFAEGGVLFLLSEWVVVQPLGS